MWIRTSLATRTSVKCRHCGKESPFISQSLGLCSDCIRHHFDQVLPIIKQAYYKAREIFSLPPYPQRAGYNKRRPPPLLVASTLLVPGYIDKEEIAGIATFISSLDPNIPYALLAFHPDFLVADLLATYKHQAMECLEVAKAAGLNRVRLGNIHLLHD